jgi:hypothetical protein
MPVSFLIIQYGRHSTTTIRYYSLLHFFAGVFCLQEEPNEHGQGKWDRVAWLVEFIYLFLRIS